MPKPWSDSEHKDEKLYSDRKTRLQTTGTSMWFYDLQKQTKTSIYLYIIYFLSICLSIYC